MHVPPPGLPVPIATGPPVSGGRDLVVTGPSPSAADRPPPSATAPAASEITNGTDLRSASPRQMANLSLDLYAAGMIAYDDYAVLAFQPELHPDYDKTVGALTGEPAEPDRRRDFVQVWDEQLQFELRHGAGDSRVVRQTARIRDMLKQMAEPTEVQV